MNNLIRQFERESNIDVYGLGLNRVKWEASLEKFAQLIVAECAKVIFETQVEYTETDAMHRIRDRVKQHFGVEE